MKKLVFGVICTCFLTTVSAQTTILSEDFQSGSIPGTWTIVINDTSTVDSTVIAFEDGWIATPDPDSVENIVAGATSFFTVPAQADRWLITPSLALGAYGNFLQWMARSHDPSFQDDYYILVSTTDSLPESFTDTIGIIEWENAEWASREVNLSEEGYDNQTIYVAFVLRSYDAFKLYLDNIIVRKEDPLSVNELTETKIELYPNPASENVTIKGTSVESVRILSMSGQLVHEQKAADGEKINVSMLQAGTYLVEVTTAEGIGRSKLLKR
jgi:hypothetical protein